MYKKADINFNYKKYRTKNTCIKTLKRKVRNLLKANKSTSTKKKSYSAEILCAGDLMCEPSMSKAAKYDGDYFFKNSFKYIAPILKKADLVIGNLETIISDRVPYAHEKYKIEDHSETRYHFNAPNEYLNALKYAGFNVLALANNHNADGGYEGLIDTLDNVDKVGILRTGMFKNEHESRYLNVDINGIKIGIFSYTEHINCNLDERVFTKKGRDLLLNKYCLEKLRCDIRSARNEGAEFLICYMHFGGEKYSHDVLDRQRVLAQTLADEGIDCIMGTHTHSIQEYDVLESKLGKNVPVVYSLGNFITSDNVTRTSIIYKLILKKIDGKVCIDNESYIPCRVVEGTNKSSYIVFPTQKQYRNGVSSELFNRAQAEIYSSITSKVQLNLDGDSLCENKNVCKEKLIANKNTKSIQFNKNATLTLKKLAEIFSVTCSSTIGSAIVNRVLTQSAYVNKGDVVIAARWYNEKKTIDEALERGATAVFCTKKTAIEYNESRVIGVDNTLECVENFEKWCEQGCNAKRITITGSVGKTTTTGLINSVIANSYKTLTHHSMSNSHGAILRNFQKLTPEHEFWVQEVGGVQPRYIESSARMMHSDVVVLTNIGTSHLNNYKTKEGIFKDKSSLERYAKYNSVVIINKDDDILKNAEYSHRVITFGINDKNSDYYAENIKTNKEGITFDVVCEEGNFPVNLNLYGKYNVYNALAAIAVGRWADLSMDRIIELLELYRPSGMRQNMLNIGGYTLLVDCFNAEPRTVLGSAETLSEMDIGNTGKKIFITGHIDKLGGNSIEMHTKLGHDLSKLSIDKMVFFAGHSKYTYDAVIEDGYKNAYFMHTREELDNWIRDNITTNDVSFYKSGQFEAALAKTIDHVYGTSFQNEQQYNNGLVETDNDYSFKLRQDDIVELFKYVGTDKNIKIPEFYEDKNLLRIAYGVFSNNSNLESVVIPDSIVNIGREAFFSCFNLKEIKLPSGLKYIQRSAFNSCIKLEKVYLPNGLLHIEKRAFKDCLLLKEVFVPESVGFIGEEAFDNCPEIKFICKLGSYAEEYAKENDIKFLIG